MSQVDPANLKPGEQPPVPNTREELLIEALRAVNRYSLLLTEIAAWSHKHEAEFTDLEDLLVRRFSNCSGVHLFIAANNLGVDLPPDLDGSTDVADDEYDFD
jgi:hypothetical protein